MLVLSRKIGEVICIGDEIQVVVLEVKGGRVKLGFAGPRDVQIRRGELPDSTQFAETAVAVMSMPVPALSAETGRPVVAPLRAFRAATSGV